MINIRRCCKSLFPSFSCQLQANRRQKSSKPLENSPNDKQTVAYCMHNVRKYDYENFLATLLIKDNRPAFALRAFNVEVARIQQITSDDKIAAMRLKFWENAIEKIFDKNTIKVPDHPVVNELKVIVDSRRLSKKYLQALVSARQRPRNQGFLTMRHLEEYCENSVSSIYYLLLETAGIKELTANAVCAHLGKAQGLTNILRSIPHITRGQTVPIPQDILMKHGVSQERILRQKEGDKGVEECIFEVASEAHIHLEQARAGCEKLPKQAMTYLLPGVAVARYLERLRRANFYLVDKNLLKRDSILPISLYWNRFRGRF